MMNRRIKQFRELGVNIRIDGVKISDNKELVSVNTEDVNKIIELTKIGKVPLDELRVEAMVNKLKIL